ncbi:hypothetical protein Cgig2_033139 [Carnegiea gigantea]|uniref:Uncharacterized protein n=1 Tax=Carnegiea gigantea TaxID=171969 RepID=A0A9Q1JHI5_9CARY|nr:hypothetical protein Cgig2_033139 [Carnegiea gigantea]
MLSFKIMLVTDIYMDVVAYSKKIIATSDHVTLKSSAIEYEKQHSRQASEEDGDYMSLEDKGPDNVAAAATKASIIRTRGTRRQANDVLLFPGLFSNLTFSSPYISSFIAYFSETKILNFFSELRIPPMTTTLGGNNDSARRQSRRANREGGDCIPLEDEGSLRVELWTRATSRQPNDVMLSSIDMFDGSSKLVRRDNAATSSVREGKCCLLGYLLLLIFLYLHNSFRSIF